MPVTSNDFVQLSRLAVAGDMASSLALIRRTQRRLAKSEPGTADALATLLAQHQEAITRRAPGSAAVPTDIDSRLQLARMETEVELHLEPTWPDRISAVLHDVIAERDRADHLAERGLQPSTTLLFTGPPGVGKTLAARWLARELSLPLVTLDLSAVMSSFLGRTGNNLRSVLDYAGQAPCVLLLDEFDAIAKRRADAVEVGELKRLVTVLLQAIDSWPSHGLLISATNHPELLDPAVWRRFDAVVEFPAPSRADLADAIQRATEKAFKISPTLINAVASALAGRSFADAHLLLNRALRHATIRDIDPEEALVDAVADSARALPSAERIELAVALTNEGMPARAVNRLTKVSRDTIRKRINLPDEENNG